MKPSQTLFQKSFRYILPRKCAITSEKMRHNFRGNAPYLPRKCAANVNGFNNSDFWNFKP